MNTSKSKRPLKKLQKGALSRRLALSAAGVGSGVRLLGKHAGSVLMTADKKRATRQQALADEAHFFVARLGELKGAYVKIGQMMALYGDHLLPTPITTALHTLEDQTASMHWETIEPVLANELADKRKLLEIDPNPLAAASLAQVHRAHDKTGRQLCIKVQYPGIADTIEDDFKTVLQMLRLTRWVPSANELESWMAEIKQMLVEEVDYFREQTMTAHVAKLLADDPRYMVPAVDANLSTGNVLTMDFIDGLDVFDPRIQALSQRRRNRLAQAMLDIFFREVFEWGLMQTDPNFGNYRIVLRDGAEQQDRLALLDFGAVRQLDEDFRKALQRTILAAYDEDRAAVIAGAVDLRCLQANQAKHVKDSFADFCILLMEPFRKDKSAIPAFALNARRQYKWRESKLLKRVGKVGAKAIVIEGFQSPPREFALIARKLTGVFSFVAALGAEFNANSIIERYRMADVKPGPNPRPASRANAEC